MKRILCLLLTFSTLEPLAQEYKTLNAYGQILYTLIDTYVTANSTNDPSDVVAYINSDATQTIFSDADIAGYPEEIVIFETYQLSFTASAAKDVIITGLHDTIVQKKAQPKLLSTISQYGEYANMGVTCMILVYIARDIWHYFKYTKPLLDSYRTTLRSPLNTNGPFGNPLEPSAPLLIPQN